MNSMQVAGTQSSPATQGAPPSISNVLMDLALEEEKLKFKGWFDGEFQRIKNQRQVFERQWHINLAFTAGRQNVSPVNVPGSGFKLVAPRTPPWRVRLVINKIRVAVRTECAKLTSSKPMPVVIPATTEDEDYAAARVAEQILKSEFASETFDETVRSWVWWGVCTGTSFLKSYWAGNEPDDSSLVEKPVDPIQALMAQAQGQPPPTPERVPATGKIKYERINPFHIYVPDLLEETIEGQPFVIHSSTKTPLWVEKNFGIRVAPDSRASNTMLEASVLNPVGATNDGFDSVLFHEIWIKPGGHPAFPQGGIATIVGDRVVQYIKEWPIPFSDYPFYKYSGIPTGGFYSESIVTDLLPIQKEYNRTKSQMIEIKNTMGKPKLMAYRGSIDPRKVSSEPGQAILVTPGYQMPTILPPAEVPSTMQIELDRLISDFDDISGQHEITRGNTPSQVTSGTAISFLQEQDDTKLSYQVASIEHAIAKLGRHYLKYAAEHWDEQRLVRIVGRDGTFEALHWQRNVLRGNTDVRVQSGSALPVSKAARQAFITELMTMQILDPQVGLEMMELGGLDKVLEDFLVDKRAAQRENLKLAEADPKVIAQFVEPPVGAQMIVDPATGNEVPVLPNGMPWQPQSPLPVNSWDNHEAHIHFHNQFRKSQQFELLDEILKKAFELHVQTHQMALMTPQMGEAGIVANSEMQQAEEEGSVPSGGEATQQGTEQQQGPPA